MAWMLRLAKIGTEGEEPCTDVMQVNQPGDLRRIADPGLTLAEAKRLLAGVQPDRSAQHGIGPGWDGHLGR